MTRRHFFGLATVMLGVGYFFVGCLGLAKQHLLGLPSIIAGIFVIGVGIEKLQTANRPGGAL